MVIWYGDRFKREAKIKAKAEENIGVENNSDKMSEKKMIKKKEIIGKVDIGKETREKSTNEICVKAKYNNKGSTVKTNLRKKTFEKKELIKI